MEKRNNTKKNLLILPAVLLGAAVIVYYYLFSSMTDSSEAQYLYIDDDDTVDSVYAKLQPVASAHGINTFKALAVFSGYANKVRPGRYAIKPGDAALNTFRRIKNGMQTPVNLTIPSVRTMDRLASTLSKKLMLDSATIYNALTDSVVCKEYGYTVETMPCMFIPNTYDIYWNISLDAFLKRMKKENERFWDDERMQKAETMGFSPEQVITLASIVDEETANDAEKPMVAGMYYNRWKIDMPLQADPTIKFALGDFSIRRIYNNMLSVCSPYNTYRNTGLPPGPIRIPTVAGIDAVLNHVKHDYLYMCAKEDFSGTHNFAVTYSEHLKNAAKYSAALNARGVR